jgi:hypothetical protein
LIWCGFAPLREIAVVEQKRKEVKEDSALYENLQQRTQSFTESATKPRSLLR